MNCHNNSLSFLPVPSSCNKDNFLQKIKFAIEHYNSDNFTDFQNSVTCYIVENFDFLEYSAFRKSMVSFTEKELELSQPTILKLMTSSVNQKMLTLNIVSQNTDFYPSVKRVYIQEDEKKVCQITENPIHPLDCYSLLYTLHKQFTSFVQLQAKKLVEKENIEDFSTLYDSVFEIFEDDETKYKNCFICEFESHFSFLENTLYDDLYENYHKNFGYLLLESISQLHQKVQIKKERKKHVDYYHYRKNSNIFNQMHPNVVTGAFKIYKKRGK